MTQKMGMYAVQTDHPGLMKSIVKRKTTKKDKSPFSNDADASKNYIHGETSDGVIIKKINNKLEGNDV